MTPCFNGGLHDRRAEVDSLYWVGVSLIFVTAEMSAEIEERSYKEILFIIYKDDIYANRL